MKITKPQLRNRIRKMIREAVGETSTDSLTREQNAVLHRIEKQHQLLGISGKNPVVLDLKAGAEVKIWADGAQRWFLNRKLHREDGPAVILADGSRFWIMDGKKHREDGPAMIRADGSQFWFLNGKQHRTDGPAVIGADGSQRWFLYGEEVTQKEHIRGTTSERTSYLH